MQPALAMNATDTGGTSGGLAFMVRALRHRNYRLFFTGQSVSLIGTWMTRIATSWLVYRLTRSPLLLGLVGFAGQIPSFLLAPVAGVLVDRWNRHRLLVATQVLAMLQSAALAVLALTGRAARRHAEVFRTGQPHRGRGAGCAPGLRPAAGRESAAGHS